MRRSPTYPELIRDIPDMQYINREVRIREVARELDLKLDGPSKIHCWHKHGDRRPSVGIRASNNTLKCFGCDSKPLGPIDLVIESSGHGEEGGRPWPADPTIGQQSPARTAGATESNPECRVSRGHFQDIHLNDFRHTRSEQITCPN